MNQKEINELRRRFRPEKSAISRVYGCYVNSSKEIVSDLDESLGMMPQEESEKYLSLLKKGLSGSLGKNLIDIVFSTQQVADSEEHRLLTTLWDSQLKDNEARQTFYHKVIDSLDMGDSSYLLLLACDSYDVPHRGKDDSLQADASDEVFTYIVCVVCPIKEGKVELGYFPGDNEFHCAAGQTVAPPELGFLFPAFDDRAANIYNALFYSRKANEIHQEFIDAIFHVEAPMSAADNDVERAEHGIIFIDEIDKIAKKRNANQRDVSGESVQQGMLKLLEGAEIEVPVGASSKNAMVPMTTVDTKNILFICGGAFPELEEVIKERLNKEASIGFKADLKDKYDKEENLLCKVTVEDVRKFGMIPEFLGRLPILFSLEALTEDACAYSDRAEECDCTSVQKASGDG